MNSFRLRYLMAVALMCTPALAVAQQPTPAQAQQAIQRNPALLDQLKQRILSSGLTPDQVRARLRAEGYPENMLDAYLPGGGAGDSTATTEDVFGAVAQLGLADTSDVSLLRCGANPGALRAGDS